MLFTVGLALFFVFVVVLLVNVLTQVDEKATVRASLRQLDGYEVSNVRDQELLKPVSERALEPIFDGLLNVGKRFTPIGYIEKTKRQFASLGYSGTEQWDRFMAVRVILRVLVIPYLWMIFKLDPGGMLTLALAGVGTFVLAKGPDAILNRKVEERQHEIRVKLPDVLDLLVISVEAGLGFEQALERTAAAVPGPLSEESRRMLQETRMGASRADALRALDERTQVDDLGTFILAMLQADAFGVSISRILRGQADEIRIRRRQAAQELSQKAPIKMLVPLAVCIFPAIFVVVLLPAAIQVFKVF